MTVLENRDEFDQEARPAGLATALDRAALLLDSSLDAQSPLFARLSNLRDRLAHQRLQIAVLGQFKRGKSSFVNALLGAPLLPSAVVPVTAIVTFISWRAKPLARISFNDNKAVAEECGDADKIRDFLFRFVSEEANPQNRLTQTLAGPPGARYRAPNRLQCRESSLGTPARLRRDIPKRDRTPRRAVGRRLRRYPKSDPKGARGSTRPIFCRRTRDQPSRGSLRLVG